MFSFLPLSKVDGARVTPTLQVGPDGKSDVTDIELAEILELQNCQYLLEQVLRRLDQVGSGIAAIHVNAAIEQIKANERSVRSSSFSELDAEISLSNPSRTLMH